MEVDNLIESFSEFKEMKNIDRETMMNVLEEVFRSVMAKQYGTDENIDVIINVDKGDLELWRNREIVEDDALEDENLEIAYSDAVKIEPDFEVGEEVSEQIFLKDFGRRQVLALRQTLVSRIMDLEKKEIYEKWKTLINMSQEALDKWAENPARLEASLNRERAKEEGGIQSGLDSLHRIKRRKSKPLKEWSDVDFDNAAQENGFNSRMLGGKIGQPVGSTGMSKWEISLRNWGHDPNLSSSPANSKYNAWKKSNKTEIAKSKAKKKSSQRVAYEYLLKRLWKIT